MQEILLKIRYFERELSKSLKRVNFIFSFEPSPFIKNNRGLELVGFQVTKQVQRSSFISYILPDQV